MSIKKIVIIIVAVILAGTSAWLVLNKYGEKIGLPVKDRNTLELERELAVILSKAQDIDSLKYELIIDAPEDVITANFWQKKEKVKMAIDFDGQKIINLVNIKNNSGYSYFPSHNLAIKIGADEVQETLEGSIKNHALFVLDYDPIIVASEIFDNKECIVIEYATNRERVKMWIWEEYGLPVQIKIETLQGVFTTKVNNIELIDIPDEIFELPDGTEITEI